MKINCEKCKQREATVHLTEIVEGQKIEYHFCQECAHAEGVTIQAQLPLGKVLEGLALQSQAEKELAAIRCPVCGMSFLEFRQHQLLGCPNDYEAFDAVLTPLLARAHEGATAHVGKIPVNAAEAERRQSRLLRLRGELKQAVRAEDYERAAALRDDIKKLEES